MIHTSLKLSKQLSDAGCKLKSDWYWQLNPSGWILVEAESIIEENDCFPAYDLLWDVCVKYSGDFFGKDNANITLKLFEIVREVNNPQSKMIAEDYIWKHTVFNNRGK